MQPAEQAIKKTSRKTKHSTAKLARPIIRFLRHDPGEQAYRFFWLMRIEEVNLDEHCQRCLLGYLSRVIRTRMFYSATRPFEIQDVPLEYSPSGKYYLCGVTMPYRWEKNFHLAFGYRKGSVIHRLWHGLQMQIDDAEPYLIKQEYMDTAHRRYQEYAYRTCRNAQFAWGYKKGLYLPGADGVDKENEPQSANQFVARATERQLDFFDRLT